jgi:ribonucleotide reductase alpha subunit
MCKAGINLGILAGVDTFKEWKTITYMVKALDKVIDLQDYPVKSSEKQIKRRIKMVLLTTSLFLLGVECVFSELY